MGERYLFLDNQFINKQENVIRIFHPWEKEVGNPVIQKAFDWEGIGPGGFRLTGQTDPTTAIYVTFGGKGDDYPGGWMVSKDGINWEQERQRNDAIDDGAEAFLGFYDKSGTFSSYPYLGAGIIRRTEAIPQAHLIFRRSKDGVHWERFPGEPYWIGSEDVFSFMYDTRIHKYVIYGKLTKIQGITTRGEYFLGYTCNAKKTINGSVIRITGQQILPERKEIDVELRYGGGILHDDGGGGIVDEKAVILRVIARAESEDFIHWTNHSIVMEPPSGAPLGHQYYGLDVRQYAGMYIGHAELFTALDGHCQMQLVWSYDGIDFTVNRDSFILPISPSGWDCGGIYSSTFQEFEGGRLCLYYSAQNANHMIVDVNQVITSTGRAWLRQDGFASLCGGLIETVPLEVTQKTLCFNMKGVIDIVVRSVDGKVIGKTQLRGDYHNLIPNIDLTDHIGKKVLVEMDLRKGELFSIKT